MKCNGAHCKCMNLGGSCPNNHYATCSEHGPKTTPPMHPKKDPSLLNPYSREDIIITPEEREKVFNEDLARLTKKHPPMRTSEITKENLRVGDVIVRESTGGNKKILEVFKNTFCPSVSNSYHQADGPWTFEEAQEIGWRIKLPASEQPKQQLTHEQIEERLGYEIEIIKE